MMESTKKLTRGLKDISPIFTLPEPPPVKKPAEVQILSVSCPNGEGDSLLLNTYFASRLASSQKPCSLISILSRASNVCPLHSRAAKVEPFGQHIKRHTLFWDELQDVLAEGKIQDVSKDRNAFLDFEYTQLLYFPEILTMLDKWVLLLKPDSESLIEGYKMLKAGLTLNPLMECFVLLESKANPPADSSIFEKFAAVASKHLNINLGWLGWLDLSDPESFFNAQLNVDQLHFQPSHTRPSLEKMVLASWLESSEGVIERAIGERGMSL